MAKVRLISQATSTTAQIGTYENPVPSYETSGTWLWEYFRPPPAQNSILIASDGTVTEVSVPLNKDIKAATVYIPGGHQFETEDTSFAYTSLVAAGYQFEAV
mgnify:CR=1 FL=1